MTKTKNSDTKWLCCDPLRDDDRRALRLRSIKEERSYRDILVSLARGYTRGRYDGYLAGRDLQTRLYGETVPVVAVRMDTDEKLRYVLRARGRKAALGVVMRLLVEGYARRHLDL